MHRRFRLVMGQYEFLIQESPADAMVTRDSNACMKALATHQLSDVSRDLGFLTFRSCNIRWEDPKNPTLVPNITSIGKPVTKLWPFLDIQDGRQPPSWISGIRTFNH